MRRGCGPGWAADGEWPRWRAWQTRWHRDLDLAVDAADLGRCLAVLGQLGYAAGTDWLPSRIELRAPGDCWVDVHPVAFGPDGTGR